MAGQRWENGKRGAAKALNRWISEQMRKGKTVTVYTVRENDIKTSPVPRPLHVYARHTFTSQSRWTGEWMTSHMSASGLLAQEGVVYEQKPFDMREIGDPGPGCPPPRAAEVSGWVNY
jgi:hypothetical protein